MKPPPAESAPLEEWLAWNAALRVRFRQLPSPKGKRKEACQLLRATEAIAADLVRARFDPEKKRTALQLSAAQMNEIPQRNP